MPFAKFLANAEIQKIMHQLSAHNTSKSPPFWMILSALESAEVGKDDVHIKVNKGSIFENVKIWLSLGLSDCFLGQQVCIMLGRSLAWLEVHL